MPYSQNVLQRGRGLGIIASNRAIRFELYGVGHRPALSGMGRTLCVKLAQDAFRGIPWASRDVVSAYAWELLTDCIPIHVTLCSGARNP